uniref:Ammonium_transp domain-containing protein n=1 Tax=Heterorhabditis bacteriophora TaxID=37862 RepID=A0A1I7XES2_HETBA
MLSGESSSSTIHCEPTAIAQQSTASASSVNRRETFDNDSMPSSSKVASTTRSPGRVNTLFASSSRSEIISDQITEWFNGIIFMRKLQAAVTGSFISGCIFMLSIVFLQFSIWAPVQFIYDAFSSIFSLSSWFTSTFAALSSFASSFVMLILLCKADQMRHVCVIYIIFLICLKFTSFLGSLIFGISSLFYLLSISFYFTCGILILGQLFATKALMKLVRQIVMKPFTFPLPPPFAVHSPKPEQTRTLTTVLGSHDKLLKLFAFFDLRRIAWTDRIRRQEVFSLSQPGGHPRNWSAVSSSCVQVLDGVRHQLEIVSVTSSLSRDIDDDDDDELDKEMLMMPYKTRKQLYSSAIRKRHRTALRPSIPKKVLPGPQGIWLSKLSSIMPDKQATISRYDANLCILAIESLYMLIVESYHDDRYGVVLKDLAAIIGTLLSLISTIDKFFRSRADVHLMIFVGFGFLMAFLKRYGFSAVSVNLLLSAFVIQWAMLIRGFLSKQFHDTGTFTLGVPEMMCADSSCAVVLITMGVLLGRMTPAQFILLAFFETSISVFVEHIVFNILHELCCFGCSSLHLMLPCKNRVRLVENLGAILGNF